MNRARATYFCIDIECSGQVPAIFDMISLGAVVVRRQAEAGMELGETFYIELAPVSAQVDPGAMAVNGLDIEQLRRSGIPRPEALRALNAWVREQTVAGTTPVFVGHNAPFDWSFVAYSYRVEGIRNPFGYKALDTKALAMGVLGVHWLDSNKDVLADALGLPPEDHGQKHRADYDAHYQALILVGLLERQAGR